MQQLWLWIAAWIIEATERNSTTFFRSLKALCSCFSRRVRDIDSRRCATRARINARNDSRRARRPRSLLHLPFVFPLNYLRVLRDWPTNPVRLNNLPIIRGPLCFIRRVSNKSHCVFRRAASNSIRVRTRTLSAYPGAGKRRREETEEEATGEIAERGAIAHDSHELTRNSAEHREFMTRPHEAAPISPSFAPSGITSIANVGIKFNT